MVFVIGLFLAAGIGYLIGRTLGYETGVRDGRLVSQLEVMQLVTELNAEEKAKQIEESGADEHAWRADQEHVDQQRRRAGWQ